MDSLLLCFFVETLVEAPWLRRGPAALLLYASVEIELEEPLL